MNRLASLEALLFQYGEPIALKDVSRLLKSDEKACEELIAAYGDALQKEDRGLALIKAGNTYQLATKGETSAVTQELVKDAFKEEPTPAVVEVTTLVAYIGPAPKSSIDAVRGVNSALALRNALMRGFIDREKHKNAYHYFVTTDFLRHLGVKDIAELPDYEKHRKELLTLNS